MSLYPFVMPAGMSSYSVTVETLIPVALQSSQGCLITRPMPLHLVHSRCITIELWRKTVDPDPPHARHRVGAVPGLHLFPLHVVQVSFLSNSIAFLMPFTD